jgi:hypothetical protein
MSRLFTNNLRVLFLSTSQHSQCKNITTCHTTAYNNFCNFNSLYALFRAVKKNQLLYVIGGCCLRSLQVFYSPCTLTCRTLTYTIMLRTEWKYKCKWAAAPTLRGSHNCTDTALGKFFHLQCGFQLQTHHLIVINGM